MKLILRTKQQLRPVKVKTEFTYHGIRVQVFCQSYRGWFWRLSYRQVTLGTAGFAGLVVLDEAIAEAIEAIDFDTFLDCAFDLAHRNHYKLSRKRRCRTTIIA